MSGKGHVVLGDVVGLSIAHNHAVSSLLRYCDGMKQTDETQGSTVFNKAFHQCGLGGGFVAEQN